MQGRKPESTEAGDLDDGLGQQTSGWAGALEPGGAQGQQKDVQSSAHELRVPCHRQELLAGWGVRDRFFTHPNLRAVRWALFPPRLGPMSPKTGFGPGPCFQKSGPDSALPST